MFLYFKYIICIILFFIFQHVLKCKELPLYTNRNSKQKIINVNVPTRDMELRELLKSSSPHLGHFSLEGQQQHRLVGFDHSLHASG